MKQGFVGLTEVIGQIRDELEHAQGQAQNRSIGFNVEKVSLTFTVQVHHAGTGRGGVRIGVVTAELGGSVDRQTTHQVQVDLVPETRSGGRVSVSRDAGREAREAPEAPGTNSQVGG